MNENLFKAQYDVTKKSNIYKLKKKTNLFYKYIDKKYQLYRIEQDLDYLIKNKEELILGFLRHDVLVESAANSKKKKYEKNKIYNYRRYF